MWQAEQGSQEPVLPALLGVIPEAETVIKKPAVSGDTARIDDRAQVMDCELLRRFVNRAGLVLDDCLPQAPDPSGYDGA